jgi:aryl sulfotransferase
MRRYRSVVMDNARWEGFEFRAGDIVISTPPKCGTTWMQMLCALLVFQDTALPQPLTELSPWFDVQTRSVADVVAALSAQQHRRFIKSHTAFDGLPHDDRVTYICVGRDMRDAGLSWDNHMQNLNLEVFIAKRAAAVGLDDLAELMPDGLPDQPDDPSERFWKWVEEDPGPIDDGMLGMHGALNHLRSFWDHRDDPNVLLFHYGDMQADLEGEMRRLATALGIEVDEALWPTLLDAAGFEQMRARADELAPQVTDGYWYDNRRFFHRGSGRQWEAFFAPGDDDRYRRRIGALAPDDEDFVNWVHHGWRGLPA